MIKILIVDDETELVDLYKDLLSNDQREITVCHSGDKALAILKDETFDLIISDKKMGKISGLQVLDFVKKNCPNTIFFLITGDSSEEVDFANSKSELIRKPFSFQDLNTKITKIEDSRDLHKTKR